MESTIDIRELRYFIQIARAGSFSRAAAELYIAQPALSRQITKLEQELGVQLFVRHGRGIKLTNAGALLLDRAEMITHYVRQAGDQVRAAGDGLSGHITIGMPPAIGVPLLPRVIESFASRWPSVSIHVREGLSTSLQEWLIDRRVDLAVVYNQPPLDALDIASMFTEPMVVVCPPESDRPPLAAPFRIRDLADLPLILPGLPHANRRVIERAAVQHDVHLRIVLEVDSVPLTKALVAQGFGYSLLTYTAVQDDVARGRLHAVAIERPAIRSTVSIATLRDVRKSPVIDAMFNVVSDKLHELVVSDAWQAQVSWVALESPDEEMSVLP
ncbi:LysR family transcriptional regulator [Burkholderia sp. L27(2015)]|uniref:LysR family transcriptional regulator n=1 Tax=Burkholderia sp. L27(2015) TaxID=1641858 RepID=UPI0020B154C2|nr:LysR family transcriptional regulator [Burkholderia sp. L27(2015)]